MPNLQLTSRLEVVKKEIESACLNANRKLASVELLAVSKTKPLADIIDAHAAGQRHFAENYAQEAVEKRQQAPFEDGVWHFIGPLQSNKTRVIAEHYDWVHTIDRLKIAQRLSDQRPKHLPPLNLLIQVNISDDPVKAGVKLSQVSALADQIQTLPNVSFRGLMAIPAAELDDHSLSSQFRQLKNVQFDLIKQHTQCTELSIGMSQDFQIAIAEGATMVRIGSNIFGARTPKANV